MGQLLENSLLGGVLILFVAVLRLLLKDRLHPTARLALWALCLARLLTPCPWMSVLSVYGLLHFPSGSSVPSFASPPAGQVVEGFAGLHPGANLPASYGFTYIYVLVAVGLTIWFVLAWLSAWRRIREAVPVSRSDLRYEKLPRGVSLREGNLPEAPVTFGAFHPVIVIPPDLSGDTLQMVLFHESIHVRRLDMLWKYAAVLVLILHWFNPAVWLMSVLLCRDLELSCDNALIRRLDLDQDRRKDYAHILVAVSRQKSMESCFSCRLGCRKTKERVVSILNYRKFTAAGFLLTLLLLCSLVPVFACIPKNAPPPAAGPVDNMLYFMLTDEGCVPVSGQEYIRGQGENPAGPLPAMDRTVDSDDFVYYFSQPPGFTETTADNYNEEPGRRYRSVRFLKITDSAISPAQTRYYTRPDGSRFSLTSGEDARLTISPADHARSFRIGYLGSASFSDVVSLPAGRGAAVSFAGTIRTPGTYEFFITNTGTSTERVNGSSQIFGLS